MRFNILLSLFLLTFFGYSHTQELSQTINGFVLNTSTQEPIPGVKVTIKSLSENNIGLTDDNGRYEITGIPIGIHTVSFSSVGYEIKVISNVVFSSGKQVVLDVEMDDSEGMLNQVVIEGNAKGRPINLMATVSARSIDIRESQKFPGSIDDISRIVTPFAGVSGPPYASFNFISVRGNSSSGVRYQLEGIEMLNPNHLSTVGSSGGFISVISSNVLDHSDFYTGAFPAEFVNATASVFDLQLRRGNLSKYEHTLRLSLLGVDLFSEGPLKKNKSSYLINYRYSTFGIIDKITTITGIPKYQDLTFKIHNQTKKAGTFDYFFVGGLSGYDFAAKTDSSLWETSQDRTNRKSGSDIGLTGLSHQIKTGEKSYLKSTLVGQVGRNYDYSRYLLNDLTQDKRDSLDHYTYKIGFHTNINTRFSPRHFNKTGLRFDATLSNLFNIRNNQTIAGFDTIIDASPTTALFAAYSQSKFAISEKSMFTVGLNVNFNTINNKINVEPRLGFRQAFTPKTQLNFGAGLYSKIENDLIYYSNVYNDGTQIKMVNRNIPVQRSGHLVLGVDQVVSKNIKWKNEVYYQHLFNAPASSLSGYSLITYHYYITPAIMDATSTGTNYGLESTLEGYFDKAYFIIAGTVFDSKYVSGDGIERNTEFNSNMSGSLVCGKDFIIGKKKGKKNIISTNINISATGGIYYTPVDLEASVNYQRTEYDYSKVNTLRREPTVRVDYSFSYIFNLKKYSGKIFLQIKNLYSNKVVTYDYFDVISQSVKEFTDFGLIPVIGVRFDFR